MDQEQLRKRLEFYRDLGVEQIYRRGVQESVASRPPAAAVTAPPTKAPTPADIVLPVWRRTMTPCHKFAPISASAEDAGFASSERTSSSALGMNRPGWCLWEKGPGRMKMNRAFRSSEEPDSC